MAPLTGLPPGHNLPAWRLVAFIVEFVLNLILTIETVYVFRKVYRKTSYHINLRLSVLNIYVAIPIMAISRTLMLIHVLSLETWLSEAVFDVIFKFFDGALTALWWMQLPVISERVCATLFYQSYSQFKCYGTVTLILVCWSLVVVLALQVVSFHGTLIFIMLCVCNFPVVAVYICLLKVNVMRYQNGRATQNLRARHQLFENMKSLYPILWTVALEVFYNLYSCGSVAVMIYFVVPSGGQFWHEVIHGIDNIVRECILVFYCLPFLVFDNGRNKQLFLNKVSAEGQEETKLYFQQLQDQWAK